MTSGKIVNDYLEKRRRRSWSDNYDKRCTNMWVLSKEYVKDELVSMRRVPFIHFESEPWNDSVS
jgi:hypothetical protein